MASPETAMAAEGSFGTVRPLNMCNDPPETAMAAEGIFGTMSIIWFYWDTY